MPEARWHSRAMGRYSIAALALAVGLATPAHGLDRGDPAAVVRAYLAAVGNAPKELDFYRIVAPPTFTAVTLVFSLTPHLDCCMYQGAFVGERFVTESAARIARLGQEQLRAQGWDAGDGRTRERLAAAWTVEAQLVLALAEGPGGAQAQARPDGGVDVRVRVRRNEGDARAQVVRTVDVVVAFAPDAAITVRDP